MRIQSSEAEVLRETTIYPSILQVYYSDLGSTVVVHEEKCPWPWQKP